jgi:hypothetical protein
MKFKAAIRHWRPEQALSVSQKMLKAGGVAVGDEAQFEIERI